MSCDVSYTLIVYGMRCFIWYIIVYYIASTMAETSFGYCCLDLCLDLLRLDMTYLGLIVIRSCFCFFLCVGSSFSQGHPCHYIVSVSDLVCPSVTSDYSRLDTSFRRLPNHIRATSWISTNVTVHYYSTPSLYVLYLMHTCLDTFSNILEPFQDEPDISRQEIPNLPLGVSIYTLNGKINN